MKEHTLIVPMVNTRSNDSMPLEFKYDNNTGQINCVKSIEGINTSLFTSIHFILLEKHEQKYHIQEKITLAVKNSIKLNKKKYIFTFLKYPTSSQAETIYNEIKHSNIEGPIFIKDADNMCIYDNEINGNSVLVYPLENTPIVDPQHKSYVSIDDQNFIINIIEKKVVSNLFNCGGYNFNNANDFIEAYDAIQMFEDMSAHMYISHIIYWLILNKKLKFRPIEAIGYEDFELNN